MHGRWYMASIVPSKHRYDNVNTSKNSVGNKLEILASFFYKGINVIKLQIF